MSAFAQEDKDDAPRIMAFVGRSEPARHEYAQNVSTLN
jgi:hypothetical protein